MPTRILHETQSLQILDKTVTLTGTNITLGAMNLSDYSSIQVHFVVSGLTGTSPTIQADLIAVFADGTNYDFFNNGTHPGSFTYNIGPGCSNNQLVPPNLNIALVMGGTVTGGTVRVVMFGYF